MGLFGKPKAGGFMDEIRCDEQSYLIWKWRPAGAEINNNSRENAIRWGSSLRVKDGEVAVFVYNRPDGVMEEDVYKRQPLYERQTVWDSSAPS